MVCTSSIAIFYKFENNFTEGQHVVLGLRPEYISNIENNTKLSLQPTIIETTGFDKHVTFDFAGGAADDIWSSSPTSHGLSVNDAIMFITHGGAGSKNEHTDGAEVAAGLGLTLLDLHRDRCQ